VSSGDILREMHALKVQPSRNMTIQGSYTFNSLFTERGLTDEYQFMIDPWRFLKVHLCLRLFTKKLELELTNRMRC